MLQNKAYIPILNAMYTFLFKSTDKREIKQNVQTKLEKNPT